MYCVQVTTTRTVFGFHDYVTTVDNTVMVFTPDANGHPLKVASKPVNLKSEQRAEKSLNIFIEAKGMVNCKHQHQYCPGLKCQCTVNWSNRGEKCFAGLEPDGRGTGRAS